MSSICKSSYAPTSLFSKFLTVSYWFVAIGFVLPANAQDTSSVKHADAWVEVAAYGSTSARTPFWFHANQWGVVPTTGQIGSVRAGIAVRQPFSNDTLSKKKWTYLFGLEAVGNASKHSKVFLPQAYAGIDFKGFQLAVGRFKQYVGFNDQELGSGAYMWSGNALPIPKVQLGFVDYQPLFKNFLYFKGFYSDGFFENSRPVTSQLKLHNKALFVRLGRPSGKVKLYGGFNHAVQWGGKSPYFTENGQMPRGLGYYWYVVTGLKPKNKTELSHFDRTNRIGNHVASLDAGIELDLQNINIFLYRQNLIEDGSLFYLNNVKDGLNGVTFKFKHSAPSVFSINQLNLELLYTKSQGGTETTNTNGIRGKDDYFNNSQVRDGWSYFGRGIGTPFITATAENSWPPYADFFTNNNRVWVTHMGVKGSLEQISWKAKLSLSSNQGTYDQPFPKKIYQFSGLLALAKQTSLLGGSTVQAALSLDQGKLLDQAVGLMFSIRKDFSLPIRR